jgi:hypothetical protein
MFHAGVNFVMTKFSEVRECRGLFTWIIGPTDVVWGMWQTGARAAGDENAVS